MGMEPPTLNHFHRLPDDLLLSVFNCLEDVKVLGACAAVCRRFCQLAPAVERVAIHIDCVLPAEDGGVSGGAAAAAALPAVEEAARSVVCRLMRFMTSLAKPFQGALGSLWHPLIPSSPSSLAVSSSADMSHHLSPMEVLRPFSRLQHLRIQLPDAEFNLKGCHTLRWYAEFGTSLEACVVFGCTSAKEEKSRRQEQQQQQQPLLQRMLPPSFHPCHASAPTGTMLRNTIPHPSFTTAATATAPNTAAATTIRTSGGVGSAGGVMSYEEVEKMQGALVSSSTVPVEGNRRNEEEGEEVGEEGFRDGLSEEGAVTAGKEGARMARLRRMSGGMRVVGWGA